ncbi:ABC transporter ATP-binding protein [Calidifontibacillus oryziterrae]|uniref:ABC transporter ATP-binding protein n=1 Tax=Calidifontibacillus oryziterrae TaxID=1191699 RepID=UPI0002FD0230|nr:ABC transporter ATP-binding protein [Calidifontibacillus oryziterrae]
MTEAIVTFVNVSKKYEKKEVVKDVSLQINEGEIFALLGHNGAGKSTLIKMLTGLIQTNSGEITINGNKMAPFQKEAKKQFSYLPEIMKLFPHLTAKETLRFFAELQKIPEENEDEVLELVGLGDHKNDKVGDFSKGMTQRMGFAITLLPKSKLLILDEPTSGLDPYWAIQFKKNLKQLNKEGTTVIFASHILSEVEELADRVGIMSDGEIVALGSIQELKSRATNKIKIYAAFDESVSSAAIRKEIKQPFFYEKGWYVISCDYEEKLAVIHSLQKFKELKDMEMKEITLEDIYQELLQKRYHEKVFHYKGGN